jgi:hypothetical protein
VRTNSAFKPLCVTSVGQDREASSNEKESNKTDHGKNNATEAVHARLEQIAVVEIVRVFRVVADRHRLATYELIQRTRFFYVEICIMLRPVGDPGDDVSGLVGIRNAPVAVVIRDLLYVGSFDGRRGIYPLVVAAQFLPDFDQHVRSSLP